MRRAAIAAIRDERGLGSIARNGADASARLLAIERLTDRAEIESVALRGEHADAAEAFVRHRIGRVRREAEADQRIATVVVVDLEAIVEVVLGQALLQSARIARLVGAVAAAYHVQAVAAHRQFTTR